ncbi:DUF1194 domain-containing protein [Rhodobacter sp. NTK016B]|uniref:DUF1194 domain-containing protein n=1 Tax=Rhodobacter sp. NTK016B TaxID=2759676 RepID=UPI0032E48CEA
MLGAGAAGAQDCRLALVLGFDVSASVDAREYELMMRGTATALRDPEVRAALFAGPPVALAAYVWGGRREQAVAAGWALIERETQLAEFADRLEGFPRPTGDPLGRWGGRTGVGAALAAGARLLMRAPVCDRQVIDLAGDGENNDGPDTTRLDGITVNALAVAGNMPLGEFGAIDGLRLWYAERVLQGPGAFVIEAQGFEDFARAIRLKLLREVSPPLLGAL